MVDSKSKKTFNKLGKLFGVQALPTDGEVSGGEELGGPPVTGVKPGILGVLDGKTSSNEDFLESQENDVVTPLPNDSFSSPRSMTPQNVSPKIGANGGLSTSVSPEQSPSTGLGSTGLVHPSPNKPYDVNRQSPVSRTSSTKKSSSSVAKSAPVSRSSSVNKRPPLKETATSMKPRFRMLEDGNHEHSLKSARRQEKLSNMLKDLLGAKKLRSEAKSAVPNILGQQPQAQQPPQANGQEPPTLFAGFVNQYENDSSPYHGPALAPPDQQDCRSFVEKYGRCSEVIGRGSFGTVRISHKKLEGPEEILYAVKEFKKRPNESEKKYNRRLTSEFCISSSLKNINIIDTLDLLKDAKGDYCEVMEFCSGGDLYTLIITAGKLEYAEADCFFKQLIRGVNYMHELGVSHRDLKPENLLLTQSGVVKITDFGNSECFKMAWEDSVHLSEGICGSSPYIAPEEYSQRAFDPRGVDIWSCGVIYMAMRTGRQLWKLADPTKDEFFREYLVKRKDTTGYDPIESLKRARCRNVIYSILDPKPERRINGKQILNSEWGREIKVCDAAEHSIAKSGHIAY